MDQIKEVTTWIDAAQQAKIDRNTANYIGYVLSEVGEMLNTVADGDVELQVLAMRMEHVSLRFRNGLHDDLVAKMSLKQKANLMDDAFDTAWTTIGVMHMLGDAQGAFAEGAQSNYSKFENGVCALDESGKVIKSPNFKKPNFEPFVK